MGTRLSRRLRGLGTARLALFDHFVADLDASRLFREADDLEDAHAALAGLEEQCPRAFLFDVYAYLDVSPASC